MQQYYSHGKLLISGEYLVLNGSLALAVPCKFGQRMEVEESAHSESILQWISYKNDGSKWCDVLFNKSDLSPYRDTLKNIPPDVYTILQNILNHCRTLNPLFLTGETKTIINNYLEFDLDWGLGSSSTLINNIAQYGAIDAFKLNNVVFNGSGYDIACAKSNKSVLFKKDEEGIVYDTVNFSPPEAEQIFFIHLNEKRNSKEEAAKFMINASSFKEEIEIISEISEALLFCDDFDDFMYLINEHEDVISFVLQKEKIKDEHFNDFNGAIKSLGAWGGDFVMAVSEMNAQDIKKYFTEKGFSTVLQYNEMIL